MSEKADTITKHKIPSDLKQGRYLRDYMSGFVKDMGFSNTDILSIKVAFTEALNNIILHAYKNDHSKPILIEFHCFNNDRLEIFIRDFGIKVPRAQIKSRPLNDFHEGGLGVYLMSTLMDYINYDNISEEIGTILKMVKKI